MSDAAARIASLYPSRFLRTYVRSKLSTDPVYRAVAEVLAGSDAPLLDVGCGVGLMALWLREHGFAAPILGIDHDARKVESARRAAARYRDLQFDRADARAPLPDGYSVLLLDLVHYFAPPEQQAILRNAASAVPPGGVAIVRDAIADGTWRYTLTYAAEMFASGIGWLKAERLRFPTRRDIEMPFQERFEATSRPLWGRTPFNNYLFVFSRSGGGITNV